jgi:hypothetical protein
MSVHAAQPEILPTDDWPLVEIKRQPNGKLGLLVAFPVTAELRAHFGIDEFAMNMEPQRAKRLRDQLTAHLNDLGVP